MNDENKVYEKVLEISKTKISELTWNNILFEANLDIKNVDNEGADPEQVGLLQNQLQELTTQVENLVQQNTDLDTEKNVLTEQIANWEIGKENLDNVRGNLERKVSRIEQERDSIQKTNSEVLQLNNSVLQEKGKLENDLKSEKLEKETLTKELENFQKNAEKKTKKLVKKQDDENKTIVKTLQLELKQKEEGFSRIQTKLQGSVATVTKLTQEKSDIESALATQKNLYNELRSKTTVLDNVIESGDDIQDEGVLESASS
jgi:chromosome segregation ATPase